MNITQYAVGLTSQISHISPSSLPSTLWDYYLRYLWYYKPDSTVARIAYTFRLLALILIMPVFILVLLDVAAYVLARTLGVVDDVEASTSDKGTVHETHHQAPAIIVQAPLEPSLGAPADDNLSGAESSFENESQTPVFYAGGDDQSILQLSGVGVFSPTVSTPPSPKTARNQLQPDAKDQLRQRNRYQTETES